MKPTTGRPDKEVLPLGKARGLNKEASSLGKGRGPDKEVAPASD